MPDRRKLSLLAGAGVLLVLLVMAYDPLETRFSSFIEASRRQRHYEQVIEKKGLMLHEGAFWKRKQSAE